VTGKHEDVAEDGEATLEAERESRFVELYQQHFDFVWRSVRMLRVHSGVAEDVVQDVFLVAHRRLADFEARASVRTWLFAIARRVVSTHRRSLRRRFRLLARVSNTEHEVSATPFDATARSETQRALLAALEDLPEDQRLVFSLTEIEDMSAPEIASALGINVNTVYSRLRLARRTLAARLRITEMEVTV
jgi:RNA polymerase sigma-70 factor (ECF subfamily)